MDDDGEFLLTLLHEDLAVVCPEVLPRLVHASQQLSCGAHQVLIYVDLVRINLKSKLGFNKIWPLKEAMYITLW